MKLLGGWPLVKSHNWSEENWSFQNTLEALAERGLRNSFFQVGETQANILGVNYLAKN